MLDKLLATLAASDDLLAAACVGTGVALLADPGAGLVAFGSLWFIGARLDRIRRR